MIPEKSNACWRELITGKKAIQTQALGLQLVLKRLQRMVSTTSGEPALALAVDELHAFFVKYEKILANEIKSL